jgi:anthranilate synthase component 1
MHVTSALGAGTSPYGLIEPLEAAFGSLFCFRSLAPPGQRQFLFASLEGALELRGDGLYQGARRLPGPTAARVDGLLQAAARDRADVVFALGYDSALALSGVVPGPGTTADGRLHGLFARVETAVRYDENGGELTATGAPGLARELAPLIADGLGGPRFEPVDAPLTEVLRSIDEDRYRWQFDTARERLRVGDVYQVVISQYARVRPRMPVADYFRQIAHRYRHADFAYLVSYRGQRVLGSCSLPHLHIEGDQVSTRVFAGTQPAARAGRGFRQVRAKLREDSKYFGEHIMLVDLERSDLAQFCVPGTVAVSDMLEPVVIGPTTYLATTVTGRLPGPDLDSAVLLGNFPRGVVTGAPKLRAQRLLADIEDRPRGFYSGAVGWYRAGSTELISNTTVTCAIQQGDEMILQCGGGVTMESTADQELRELRLKLAYLI